MMKITESIATVCGLGHIRFAPGTFGSLPGLGLGLLTHYVLRDVYNIGWMNFILASTGIGFVFCIIAHKSIVGIERTWRHDDKRIVIDELAGQYFATVFFSVTLFHAIASFVLFRFFDILKPWPISWVDKKWHHPFATLLDDLLASVLAIVCLKLIQF